jgi:hypothetical protein
MPSEKHRQELNSTPENGKAVFNKPFDEVKVMDSLKNRLLLDSEMNIHEVYSEMLDKRFEYQICVKTSGTGVAEVIFHILDSTKTMEDAVAIDFVFENKDLENNSSWDLRHRIVKTKDTTISGSEFFKKAEEYFKILKKNKIVKIENFTAGVSQPSVLLWLEKNGFTLAQDNKNNPSEFFESKNGEYIPRKEYVLLPVRNTLKKEIKDPYLMRADFLSREDIAKFIKKDESTGENFFDLAEWDVSDNPLREDFLNKGYIPRFHLQKPIE